MEDFQARFSNASLNEDSLAQLVKGFGDFIPTVLTHDAADVPERALEWTNGRYSNGFWFIVAPWSLMFGNRRTRCNATTDA